MSVQIVDIRPILAQVGLKTSGSKPLLIDRLWSAILEERSTSQTGAQHRQAKHSVHVHLLWSACLNFDMCCLLVQLTSWS